MARIWRAPANNLLYLSIYLGSRALFFCFAKFFNELDLGPHLWPVLRPTSIIGRPQMAPIGPLLAPA